MQYSSINQDYELTVYYIADKVNYRVRYFFQNVHDDLYKEIISLDTDFADYVAQNGSYYFKTGTTGEFPAELENISFPGFTQLYHEPDAISADGSTEFVIYFDRNYASVNFNLDGGYGIDPVIYAKYGTTFHVSEPSKTGYTFDGWVQVDRQQQFDGDGNPVLDENGNIVIVEEVLDDTPTRFTSGTIPVSDIYYKACWKSGPTTFTVVYLLQNASDDLYTVYTSRPQDATSGDTVSGDTFASFDRFSQLILNNLTGDTDQEIADKRARLEADFQYFNYDPDNTDAQVTVEGDGTTRVHLYYTRRVYTLRFYYARQQGGSYYISTATRIFSYGTDGNDLTRAVGCMDTEVNDLPQIIGNADGKYQTGQVTLGNDTLYYIQFEAPYGANMDSLWPLGIIGSVQMKDNDATTVYFATWASSKGSYHADHLGEFGDNPNIVGCASQLDKTILMTDTSILTVNFCAYWAKATHPSIRQWVDENYIPVMDGETLDSSIKTVEREDGIYKLHSTYTIIATNESVDAQTATAIEGYTYKSRDVNANGSVNLGGTTINSYTCRFFYSANPYELKFINNNVEEIEKNQNFNYGESIADKYFEPQYTNLAELAPYYRFAGWYTDSEHTNKFDSDGATMPADDPTLYAKWVPVVYTVTFYYDYNNWQSGNTIKTISVDYNDFI